jgi:hypothetical protein
MSDGLDEIPDIIARADPPKRKRRMATKRSEENDESTSFDDAGGDGSQEEEGKSSTLEELDLREMLPQQTVKPAENVKSLGDIIAKYNIGNSPEFKLQVWRTYPKIFPGGVKADGFYDTWDQPLTEELIQSEYGGGNFRVVVMGPHPTKPNTLKHYDSVSLNLAGTPKYDRQPKAVQQSQTGGGDAAPALPPMMMMGQENAKLSETAMKLAVDMASKEREERIRVEERADQKAAIAATAAQPAVEAERRRADDLIRAERERSELERKMMQERFEEARAEQKKLLERIEQMEANRPSVAAELERILPFTQQKQGDGEGGSKVAERMMESVLEKHRIEMESMRSQHQQMLDNMSKQHEATLSSMRSSHQHEIATMREAAARELQSEREAGMRRQERSDDQLRMEREERRRDQERHREVLEANDRTWKERIEMQLASTNQNWESRHQSVVATYENQILWKQQEIDRLKAELADTRARMTDNSDPIAIVHKAKEIREAIGGPEAASGGGGSSGGIGMSGADDWKNLAVEGLTERAPQLLQVLGSMISGQPQQPQQQYQVGQIVHTPQGEMVVIQTPQGLALTPKAAVEQMQAQQQSRMLPPQRQPAPRRRVMPDVDEVAQGGGRKKRRGPVSAVPNFADAGVYGDAPLPVRGRRPPWEGGGSDEEEEQGQPQPQPQPTPPAPRRTSKPQAEQATAPQQRITRQMSSHERQGLAVIAKLVHDSVMNADEPEEFAEKVIKEWPPEMLKRVIGSYSPDDIARGIVETQPSSAGATPAGQAFVRAAFAMVEQELASL